jgi:thiol-disulfide isomerase/thioredoxin
MSALPNRRHYGERTRLLALALIGAGLLLVGFVGLIALHNAAASVVPAKQTTGGIPAQLDFPAPDLRLTDLAGQEVSLADNLDQYILVNNWATWCPPCRAEMPILEAYYSDHRDQGFTLIAIESGESLAEVAAFVEKFDISFPVWLDPGGQALRGFYNNALPSSYLIDPEGTVILGWSGAITQAVLENHVTPLLNQE